MQVLLGSAQALSRHESVWGSRKYGEKVLIWLPCKCCLALHPRCHDMRGNFTKFFMERSMWAVSGLCCKDLRRSDVNMMLLGPPYYSTSNCHDLLAHLPIQNCQEFPINGQGLKSRSRLQSQWAATIS